MNARPAGFLRFASLFAALALLSCGKEEPPLDESLPIGEFDELWPGKVLGCGVPLNRETDKPLASFEELKNADCDTLIFSKERHRDKWDELARLGDCSDGGGAEMDYRAIFRESATGKIVLGIGREGRTLQLEDGRKCAVAEENVLDVCRIYNELFGTPESRLYCPVPLFYECHKVRDFRWRSESDYAGIKQLRRTSGDSAIKVYGIHLNTFCTWHSLEVDDLVDSRGWPAVLSPAQVRDIVARLRAAGTCRHWRSAGACRSWKTRIDYRVVAVDARGRLVFGLGPFGRRVRIGEDEFCRVPEENLPLVRQLYEEIFPADVYER